MALEHQDATEPVLLIYRPYMEVAERLGMAALSVPALAVALVAAGIRTPSAALLDLDAMRDNTSEDLIGLAENAIRALA